MQAPPLYTENLQGARLKDLSVTLLPSRSGRPCPLETIYILYPGVSLTTPQDDRSIGTITEYPECESQDISSPEVDYPPRLQKHEIHRKGQAGATLTKLNPENSQTVSRHMPTVNPATQAHHPSQRSTFTGNTRDVGKKQSIKRSRSVSETMSGPGDCHQMFQCQHCLKDLSNSSDSGIELQPGASSIGPRRNSDPLLSQHPETSSNAIGKKNPSQQSKVTKRSSEGIHCIVGSSVVLCSPHKSETGHNNFTLAASV